MDNNRNKFTRGDLILSVAESDGGGNVDPSLEQGYSELTRGNSLGWYFHVYGEEHDFDDPVLPSIRQMAHELILTFKKSIPEYF